MKEKHQRLKIGDVDYYSQIVMIQPLKRSSIVLSADKVKNDKWKLTYTSNSPYNICPYDGSFKDCEGCSSFHEEDGKFDCTAKPLIENSKQICERVNDCYKADLEVKLIK